jgi:hypothetical protein
LSLDNFKHSSAVRNVDTSLKQQLESAINYIYRGINRALNQLSESKATSQTSIEKLFCKTTATTASIKSVLLSFKKNLESKIIYQFHDSSDTTKCKDNTYFPFYRDGQIIHICPTYLTQDQANDCKDILTLAEITKHEVAGQTFDNALVEDMSPYSADMVTNMIAIFNNQNIDINQACTNIAPYKLEDTIAQKLAKTLIIGLISKEPQLPVDSSTCQIQVSNNCATKDEKSANQFCFTNYIYINSLLNVFDNSVDSKVNNLENCNTGCKTTSSAFISLLSNLGGYYHGPITSSALLSETEVPIVTLTSTKTVNYTLDNYDADISFGTSSPAPSESEQTQNVTALLNVTDTEEVLYFNHTAYTNIYSLETSHSVSFSSSNLIFLASVYQGSGYYEVRGQFHNMANNKPYAPEISLGRFQQVKNIKAVAYDQNNLLVTFSVKKATDAQYNILVNYITASSHNILNIYPSYDGNFDIRTIADTNDFIVSYAENFNTAVTKKYSINQNKITEQYKTTHQTTDATESEGITSYLSSIVDNTYNIVWSLYNNVGIYLQSINLAGTKVSHVTKINAKPEVLKVDSNNQTTYIGIQHNHGNITLVSIPRLAQQSMVVTQHAFSTGGARLHHIDAINNDLVALTTININNTIHRIVLNATNTMTLKKVSYHKVGEEFVNSTIVLSQNKTELVSNQKEITDADDAIAAKDECKYIVSGRILEELEYYTLVDKQNTIELLEILKNHIQGQQNIALQEAQDHANNYDISAAYSALNLTANSLLCIVSSGEEENFYSALNALNNITNTIEMINIPDNF